MTEPSPTIHASAVLLGTRATLIRGPSGSGKSRLLLRLLQAAQQGMLPFARLIGDDRVFVQAVGGRLLVRPAPTLEGLLEVYGLGIRPFPYEAVAVANRVIDLDATIDRLPPDGAQEVEIEGISLPRLAVAAGFDPVPPVLAFLASPGRD